VLAVGIAALPELAAGQSVVADSLLYLGQRPPGRRPEVFAPGVISVGGAVHGSIAFMPDGTEIYWVLQRGTPGERPSLRMVRLEGGVWQDPKSVELVEPYGASEIHITPDGDRLYFVSARPWPEEWGRQPGPGSREARKVWYLQRQGDGWSSPRALPLRVNDDLGGVASTREGTLYASGMRRIRLLPSGDYGEIEWLGPPLDVIQPGGAFKGGHPYVSPDQSFVLFNDDWPGVRGYGVFVSFRRTDDTWTAPLNILERLGLDRGGSVPVLSPEQKYLFFYAAGQLWWVDATIIVELRANQYRRTPD
jgi:hypothetical protein